MAEIQTGLPGILAALGAMGGTVLTTDTTRAPLTWSTQSIRTHEEHAHDKISGAHGLTGRHQASVTLVVIVRDFTLLGGVSAIMTDRDAIEIHSVGWSVDENNAEWAKVRADAIHAALLKGQDYAAALGGSVVSVDHVADAGLLGGVDNPGFGRAVDSVALFGGGGGEDLTLDPPPQVLSATIEARLTAVVGALPA